MAGFLKWLGGGLGWATGGPVGGLIGFILGTVIDGISNVTTTYNPSQKSSQTTHGDFVASLLLLAAAVMKADNKVMKSELDFIRNYLNSSFSPAQVNEQLKFLKAALEKDFDVIPAARQINRLMEYPAKLQLLHFLFGISLADGQMHSGELNLIQQLAYVLGIKQPDFDSIKAMFVKDTTSAYTILEISADATDDEVKKAYRRMAVKYHPDKVAHLGNDIQKAAQKKFQELQEAWQTIKKERRIT